MPLSYADRAEGFLLNDGMISAFLEAMAQRGRAPGTLAAYRRKLNQLYTLLPEDKIIRRGTLHTLRQSLQSQERSGSSINLFCSAANSLLGFYGRRELQLTEVLEQDEAIAPELTRSEYLRLLSTARQQEKERIYLLIKVLVNTGIYIRELPLVTAEAIQTGRLTVPQRGSVPITSCLCGELKQYARRVGISAGPVFLNCRGKPLNRTAIYTEIQRLAGSARVDREKCTPMSMRRLYLATQEDIRQSLALLLEQSHDRLFETEQLTYGWEEPV